MAIGLTFKELTELSSFGKTPEERVDNVYHLKADSNFAEIIDNLGGALQRKMVKLISNNNERITKQLKDAGIKLPD